MGSQLYAPFKVPRNPAHLFHFSRYGSFSACGLNATREKGCCLPHSRAYQCDAVSSTPMIFFGQPRGNWKNSPWKGRLHFACLTLKDSLLPLLRVESSGNLFKQDKNLCLRLSLSCLHVPILFPTRDAPEVSFSPVSALHKGPTGLVLIARVSQTSTPAS